MGFDESALWPIYACHVTLTDGCIDFLLRMVAGDEIRNTIIVDQTYTHMESVSDANFYCNHYASTDVTFNTCVRVRRVLCQQLCMCNTLPHDNVAMVFDDLDISEVCFELAEEFAVKISSADILEIDGTVDSLVRLAQRKS